MSREELIRQLFTTMLKTIKLAHANIEVPFRNCELTRPQMEIIFHLSQAPDQRATVKELAAMLRVTSSAITHFTDPLVDNAILMRQVDPEDRRIIHLSFTKSAKTNITTFQKHMTTSINPMFVHMSTDEIREMLALLQKIAPPEKNTI